QRQIHDDDVRQPLLGRVDRLEAVAGLDHVITCEAQVLGVHLPVVGEVVDHQDDGLAGRRRNGAHRPFPLRGMTTVKVEPLPTRDCSSMRPSSILARRRQMASPRPAPPYSRVTELSAWRKSSNTLSWSSCAIPMPVSSTAMRSSRVSSSARNRTRTCPCGVNLMALVSRLSTICFTFW